MKQNAQLLSASATGSAIAEVRQNLARLITQTLNLDVAPEDIDPEAPIYGEGLGLDSIDVLEIALIISKEYGVELKADSAENHVIFKSLNALSEFVAGRRTR
ncbi:MAG: phosphopantetheine-binding protein [Steroidobacteraceae bacterium]